MKNIQIYFDGYKTWKGIKEDLGVFKIYFLLSIILSYDKMFEDEKYPFDIEIAWLFWRFRIYFDE